MVDKNFKIDDLVWAKMKGYPAWPAKIAERTKLPLKKKHHHFVYFFGSQNHAWILDEYITPHCQSKIDFYENKKTLPALRLAIDEIGEYSKSLLPTSILNVEDESSDEEVKISDESESSSSDDIDAVVMTRNDESLKPGPSKSTPKGLAMKGRVNRKQSRFQKGYFGTKTVCFRNKFQPKSKARNPPQSNKNLKTQKPKASILLDKDPPPTDPPANGDVNDSDFIMVENEDDDMAISVPKTPPRTPLPPRDYLPPTSKKIGFLGLGVTGITLVKHLLKSNHNVTVWDRNVRKVIDTEIRGAKEGLSPSDVAEQCDIIFSCFYHSDVIDFTIYDDETGVLHGLGGCNGTKSYVEMTSIGEQKSKDIAEVVNKQGAAYLEAQINGSIDSVEIADVIIFASGDQEVYDSCSTVFAAISTRTYYIGAEVGGASCLNVLCNMFSGCISAALAEAMSLASQMKLSLFDVMTGLNMCDLTCPIIEEQGRAILSSRFNSSYFLKAQQRDMNLGLQIGNEVDHVMPVTAAANATLIHAKRLNFPWKDSSILYMASKR